jgi:Spy/CpxP family protein refolding chaperone
MNSTRYPSTPAESAPIAVTAYPFLSCMIKQLCLMAGAVVVFAGGIFAGNFAATTWPGPAGWFGANRPLDALILEKMKSELDLTPAQTARIAPIITAACSDLRLVSEERRAQRLALMDEIGASIAPDLSAEQQHRLEALENELQHRQPVKGDMRIVALY